MAYFEEYSGGNLVGIDRKATETLKMRFDLVDKELRANWASVEALANALLQAKTLSEGDVFEIVGRHLSEEAKAKTNTL